MLGVSEGSATPTELLQAWGRGDAGAFDRLVPLVHDELRRIARRYMGRERADHTLQASALVNEAYLRLIDVNKMQWQNRAQFFGLAARTMRRILVDFARARGSGKRGGGIGKVTLDEALVGSSPPQDLVALDEALQVLEKSTRERAGWSSCGSSGGSRSRKPPRRSACRSIR